MAKMTSARAKELSDKVCEILQEFKSEDVIGEDIGVMFVSMDMTLSSIQVLMGTSDTVFRQMIYQLMDKDPKMAHDIMDVAVNYVENNTPDSSGKPPMTEA